MTGLSFRYPVILSIENHCSVKQQRVMVDVMTSIFGDKLFCGTIDEKRTRLPSPEDLKGKILIKVCLKTKRMRLNCRLQRVDL